MRSGVWTIILVFILSPISSFGQLPELFDRLAQKHTADEHDTALVHILNDIADKYMRLTETDSAQYYARQAADEAVLIGYHEGHAEALANMAKSYYKTGDYDLSVERALEALKISEEHNDLSGKANAYNVLGLVYLSQDKNQAALEKLGAAAAINAAQGNTLRLFSNYFNIALLYSGAGPRDSAITYLRKANAIAGDRNDPNMRAMIGNRMGDIFYVGGAIDSAMASFRKVIDDTAYQQEWETAFANTGLAMCYEAKGDYPNAVKYGKIGLEISRKLKAKWDIKRSLAVVKESYAGLKNYEQAYRYAAEEKLVADSLFNEAKETEINALHLKQENAERQVLERKNQLAIQKNKVNKILSLLFALVAVFLLVLVFVLYRNSRKKNTLNRMLVKKSEDISEKNEHIEMQNEELAGLIRTKDQLFSIIGHDLRSPLSSIIGSLDVLRSSDLEKDEMLYLFDRLQEQTMATAAMIDNLLLWANSQSSGIVVRPSVLQLPAIVDDVLTVLGTTALGKGVSINHDADIRASIRADKDHVKIILQNIISNAVKFTPNGGSVDVSYAISGNTVAIRVADSGIGMPADKLIQLFHKAGKDISTYGTDNEKGTGIGLVLVKKFVDENAATLHVSSKEGGGTVFTISFPRVSAHDEAAG